MSQQESLLHCVQELAELYPGPFVLAEDGIERKIIYANASFLLGTSYETKEVLHRDCKFLQGSETDQNTVNQMRSLLTKRVFFIVDILNYTKKGKSFWNRLAIMPVFENYFLGFQNVLEYDSGVMLSDFSVPIQITKNLSFEQLRLTVEDSFLRTLLAYTKENSNERENNLAYLGHQLVQFRSELLSLKK